MIRKTKTENGWVRGIEAADPRITVFKGVPFAAPPVGKNRWRAPQPCEDWEGIRDASRFAPVAVQDTPGLGEDIYCREWHVDPEIPMEEDCLYLNIWTGAKNPEEKQPVLIWFYGGALQWGYPSEMEFDGERLARRGIVVVTVNYRINVFGFMAHPQLTQEQPDAPANFGSLDQQAGIRWVIRNIKAFGGDPDNITIAGQSAGGGSVLSQMACPGNIGLFKRAVIMSGMIRSPYGENSLGTPKPLCEAEKNGMDFLGFLGVSTLEEARALDAFYIRDKYAAYVQKAPRMFTVEDGQFCVGDPLKLFLQGKCADVPVMAGNTVDEFPSFLSAGSRDELEARARSIFGNHAEEFLELSEQENGQYGRVSGLECSIKGVFGKRKEDGSLQNYYYYKFAPEIPGWDKPGCFHSVDLWFFFETLAKCWRPFTGKHYDLARQMCDYWANFIKNGNPNGVDADGKPMPEWNPYSNSQAAEMVFTTDGAAPAVGNTPLVKFLSQWMVREHEGYIKVYTRQPDADCYPGGLSYSIHMAGSRDGREFHPFNKNYGILFAEAEIRQDDTICPKGVKEPQIFSLKAGGYGIAAVRTGENGEPDGSAAGKLLLWKTEDFISFEYVGLVDIDGVKQLRAEEEISGKASYCLEIDAETFAHAEEYWSPVVNTGVIVPECEAVHSPEELERIRALAVYSDGSSSLKRVIWEKDEIDFSVPGIYEVQGSVVDKSHPFPLAKGYGDPVLFRWEGKWYYISTNDNMDDIGLYVREADTVGGLFEEGVTEHLILGRDESRELIQTFWAPEFHVIGGELYLLFAVSGHVWGPQSHFMKLKKSHPITEAESWEDPVRVRKMDGSWLSEDGITLDMTYLKTIRGSWLIWSYRRNIGTPADTGSMLYIAAANEDMPWKLASEPVLLSRPLFGWENVAGTINNEGPYTFVKDGKVYLTYSGGSANSYTYALGLFTAKETDDLLDISVWSKRCAPVLSFYSVKGEYGPGHNSFFVDEDGDLMIAYHGETGLDQNLRCDGIRRVHFRKDGFPEFGMSDREDFNRRLGKVKMLIAVR